LSFPILILPGLGNSGPQHWQSLWEKANPDFVRVQQRDWDKPVCEEWVATLEAAVKQAGPKVVLVAHSLGCLTVAHWASGPHSPAAAALLVAVPDPNGPNCPPDVTGYSLTPTQPFPFRSTVVISSDDPYGSAEHAERMAHAWGSHVVHIGNRGHINADSGLGEWSEGFALLEQLRVEPPLAGN
jgi:predicted alpha/beta hydrolase family esterase